jgi:WD40 repeat protein
MVYFSECCLDYLLRYIFIIVQVGVSCKWTNDTQHLLLEHFDTIHNSPSQIYHSALQLCPSSSWLYGCYSAKHPKVVKGLLAKWETCSRLIPLKSYPNRLSYWNNIIAVGMQYGDITILDAVTGGWAATLSGHTGWVSSVTFSSDGTLIVSGGEDKTVRLWDVQTGGAINTYNGHTKRVGSVSISMDCTRIASGSDDGIVYLWDIQPASIILL